MIQMINTINRTFMLYHGTFLLLKYLHLWISFRGRGTKCTAKQTQCPTAEATIDSLLTF